MAGRKEHCEHEVRVDRVALRMDATCSTNGVISSTAASAALHPPDSHSQSRRLFSSPGSPGDSSSSIMWTEIVATGACAHWLSASSETGDQHATQSLGLGGVGRGCSPTCSGSGGNHHTAWHVMPVRSVDFMLRGARGNHGGRSITRRRQSSGLAGWRLTRFVSAAAVLLCLVQLPAGAMSQSNATTAIPTAAPVEEPATEAPVAAPVQPPVTETPAPNNDVSPTSAPIPAPSANKTSPPLTSPPTTASPTLRPTAKPTFPVTPAPTISLSPTFSPTYTPTVSPQPTVSPTEQPTETPTESPTPAPTEEPTLEVETVDQGFYQQDIIIKQDEIFNELQTLIFEDLYQSYTPMYGPGFDEVDPEDPEATITTICELTDQSLLDAPVVSSRVPRWLHFIWRSISSAPQHRALQDTEEPPEKTEWKLRVGFTMTWRSRYIDVEGYSDAFAPFVNENLTMVTIDMVTSGLKTVVEAQEMFKEQTTPPPSPAPTTDHPSVSPSVKPSDAPTIPPTTAQPSPAPQIVPDSEGEGLSAGAIGAIVAGGGAAALIIGYFLYRSRKQRIEKARHLSARQKKGGSGKRGKSQDWSRPSSNIPVENVDIAAHVEGQNEASPGAPFGYISDRHNDPEMANEEDGGHIPPNDSLVSNQSLISAGLSMSSGSDQEADTRDHLADEFDQYKDQNLEKMRTEVEGTVTNVDGMMSQALTKALMDDDDSQRDMNELRWGGSGNSMEIEASVLCDMNDWLKRKEGASVDERRAFMQETLNKMVASVRHGVMSPEDASRTIHECAAMLGLQLAETIPETALIVTGMRKMVKSEDVIEAFKEFGEIEDAAVSPNARGFGLVRFVSPKSVLRAMEKFRKEEIVVQDVAVMIKVLKSEDMDMAAMGPPSESDMSRQFSSGQGRPGPVAGGPPRTTSGASSRASAMEAHHGPNLDTIGYPGESIGRGQDGRGGPRYPVHVRGPGSDTGSGASRGSRTSNRSSQGHKRNQSGSDANGTGRRTSSRT